MSNNVIHVTENNFKTMCDIVFNDDYIIKEKYYLRLLLFIDDEELFCVGELSIFTKNYVSNYLY